MKKYIKLYALLAMALFVGACEDELKQTLEPIQIVSGEDIVFGASHRRVQTAAKAPANRTTRTIYGDISADGKWVEINWEAGHDRMQIASPESGGVANGVAEYSVEKSTGDKKGDYNGQSTVDKLERIGEAGLQWKNVGEGATYNFYAVYPSVDQLAGAIGDKKAENCSLDKEGKLIGHLPTDQTCPDITTEVGTGENKGTRWTIAPEMDYAYMVAKADYTIEKSEDDGTLYMNEPINLNFNSLITALQFEIKAGTLDIPNSTTSHEIKILSVAIYSHSGQQIAGDFKYDIAEGKKFVKKADNGTSYSQVIQNLEKFNITLNNDPTSALDLTFFLLPTVEDGTYDGGDLKLQVMYELDGIPQMKIATIGINIEALKKSYFTKVTLPSHTEKVDASVWFQALNPNILVSQVSIPVAANTFANSSYDENINKHRTQQTKTIEEMWNMGVRGFEMVNTSDGKKVSDNATTLGEMVASEAKLTDGGTFIEYVKLLRSKQLQSCTYDNETLISGDPLILICTYSATTDGYNPARYVKQLFKSLESLKDANLKIDENTFVQLTSGSTVKDVMGKICVIIRPGNDERWATESGGSQWDPYNLYKTDISKHPSGGYSMYGLTKALPSLISSDWWSRVVLISDWGQDSWDSWHRRFGAGGFYYYATSASNYDALENANRRIKCRVKMEDYIINPETEVPDDAPQKREYYYPHDLVIGDNTTTAYVQDMVRIVKTEVTKKELTLKYVTSGALGILTQRQAQATVSWKESLGEKKDAIFGLFDLAVKTKGKTSSKDIYINNLSGYYQTDFWKYYKNLSTISSREEGGLVSYFPVYDNMHFKQSGKGGDYYNCAKEMTDFVYGILSGNKYGDKELVKGPWGLVMMDYIGSDAEGTKNENSQKLVNLIMMNNFSGFELAEGKNN